MDRIVQVAGSTHVPRSSCSLTGLLHSLPTPSYPRKAILSSASRGGFCFRPASRSAEPLSLRVVLSESKCFSFRLAQLCQTCYKYLNLKFLNLAGDLDRIGDEVLYYARFGKTSRDFTFQDMLYVNTIEERNCKGDKGERKVSNDNKIGYAFYYLESNVPFLPLRGIRRIRVKARISLGRVVEKEIDDNCSSRLFRGCETFLQSHEHKSIPISFSSRAEKIEGIENSATRSVCHLLLSSPNLFRDLFPNNWKHHTVAGASRGHVFNSTWNSWSFSIMQSFCIVEDSRLGQMYYPLERGRFEYLNAKFLVFAWRHRAWRPIMRTLVHLR